MRGEYDLCILKPDSNSGSSPLARGVLRVRASAVAAIGITPACAGSTYLSALVLCSARDHPRLRGEYLVSCHFPFSQLGSSPLARGVLHCIVTIVYSSRIIPACAGSTDKIKNDELSNGDHPRLRGEYTKKSLYLRDPCFLS